MNALSNTYNHYKSSKIFRQSRYNTHKNSELKHIYNTIVKMGKDSPVYKYDFSASTYNFAVDLKEMTGNLKTSLNMLMEETDSEMIKNNKVAVSSDPLTASAAFLGSPYSTAATAGFELEVQQLASTQVNTGKSLSSNRIQLPSDEYTFDIEINGLCYGFEFNVTQDDNNLSVQDKLANLINRANIGIHADIVTDTARGTSALQLESHKTGTPAGTSESATFKVSEDPKSGIPGTVKHFGLDDITQYPSDASYSVNGTQQYSSSNTVIINDVFEVKLKQTSPDNTPVAIGFKTNLDAVSDIIKDFTGAYNSMLDFAKDHTDGTGRSALLYKDINNTARKGKNSLDSIGLTVLENGQIQIDDNLLNQALREDIPDTIQTLNDFSSLLSNISDQAFLNPMNYVNRTIVIYPNPGKTFANPYVTSMYSGMLFNGYC